MVRFARFYPAAPAFIDFVAADLSIHVGPITKHTKPNQQLDDVARPNGVGRSRQVDHYRRDARLSGVVWTVKQLRGYFSAAFKKSQIKSFFPPA